MPTPLEIALERIEACRQTQAPRLDLSGLLLDEIPPSVFELVWLEELDLSNSDWSTKGLIKTIPPEIAQLTKLLYLNVERQSLTDLSPLQSLLQLQSLHCSRNKITDLSPLQSLLQLQSLLCSNNQITNLSPLHSLNQLKTLACRHNQITDLSPLQSLQQLKILFCSDNQITNLNPFIETLLSRQFTLHLANNPIASIPSVLLGDNYHDCYENLRHYYLALQQGFEWRRQLKIQFVGNGRVGKTSLAYALKHQKAAHLQMETTHGITIEEWTRPNTQGESTIWQVWDFGGQEIYHATHRLFLGDDCLYLLVWTEKPSDSADETHHPVSYWQEAIYDLAPNSKIILVKNKSDKWNKHPHCPSELLPLAEDQEPIQHRTSVSCTQYKGFYTLNGNIQDVIQQLAPRIYLKLPTQWLKIEAALKTQKATQKTLSFADFEALCKRHKVSYATWLADYFHKTGIVFYQSNAFGNQLILDQNWIIEAVYKVFDRKTDHRQWLLKKGGRFTGLDTQLIWQNTDETEREIYINFMCDCHICYEVNHKWNIPFAEREYIIPALLPTTNTKPAAWDEMRPNDWQYTVHYAFLHRSIIERLIIRLGETYKDRAQPWREGSNHPPAELVAFNL